MRHRKLAWVGGAGGLVLGLGLFAGCIWLHGSGETGVEFISREGVIAAGAFYDVAVVDTCSDAATEIAASGQGKIPTSIGIDIGVQSCEFSEVEDIPSATSSDPGVLAVDEIRALGTHGIVTLEALAAGSARLDAEIEASTGDYALSATYTVAETNRVKLTPRCDGKHPAVDGPGRVDVIGGWPQRFYFELYHDDQRLVGYDYYPFELGGLTPDKKDFAHFAVDFPERETVIEVSSPADPEVALDFHVYTPDAVDDLGLRYEAESCRTVLSARPAVGERDEFCNGWFFTELHIETPEACRFLVLDGQDDLNVVLGDGEVAGQRYEPEVRIDSTGQGACRVRAAVRGGAHSETIEIPFADCKVWNKRLEHDVFELVDLDADGLLLFTREQGIFLDDGATVSPLMEFDHEVDTAWGESAERFTAVVEDTFYTFADGAFAEQRHENAEYFDAWPLAPDDVLLVGDHGDVGRYRDGTLQVLRAASAVSLHGVWAASETEAYAVGHIHKYNNPGMRSEVWHFDGEQWSVVHEVEGRLDAVWGSGPEDLFAVGNRGLILHYDGDRWVHMDSGCDDGLRAVGGTAGDRVVAVGYGGAVVRYDGERWQPEWIPEAYTLRAVFFTPEGQIVVAGSGGLFAQPDL